MAEEIFDLTPEQHAQAAQLSAGIALSPEQEAQARQLSGQLDPLLDFTPDQLSALEISDPENFNIRREFLNRPDLRGKNDAIMRAALANQKVRARYEQPSAVTEVAENLPELLKPAAPVVEKFIEAQIPVVLRPAVRLAGAGKQLIETAKTVTPGKATKAVWDFAKGIAKYSANSIAGAASPFVPEEARQNYRRRAAENLAASELAITGLAGGVKAAAQKAAQVVGVAKSFSDYDPTEARELFFADLDKEATREEISRGKGAVTRQIGGEVIKELEAAEKPIRPEEVAALSAGDPFTFYAYTKVFGAAGGLIPAEAKAIASSASRWVGEVGKDITGTALEGIGESARLLSKVTTTPLAKVASMISPLNIATKVIPPAFLPPVVSTVSKILPRVAKILPDISEGVKSVGKQIRTGEFVSPSARLIADIAETTPGALGQIAGGVGFDIATTAAMAEFPEEEIGGGVGIGTAFGLIGAGRHVTRRVISGQEIAPRVWGGKNQIPTSGPFKGSEFDTLHGTAYQTATPAIKQRVNAVREFLKKAAPGVDLFYVPDKAAFETGLINQGVPVADARLWADQGGVFVKNLNGKRVAFATDIDAAPHESFHPFQDVLGETANNILNQKVKSSYTDAEFENEARRYAGRLGWDGRGDWRDFTLVATGEGYHATIEKLAQEAANIIKLSEGREPTPEDAKEQGTRMFAEAMAEATAANPDTDPSILRRNVWRGILTDAEQKTLADNYAANELAAETWDAVFKHTGPGMKDPKGLIPRFARMAGNLVAAMGGEPLAGRESQIGELPLKRAAADAVREAVRGKIETPPLISSGKPVIAPEIKAPTVATRPGAPIGTPEQEAKNTADVAAAAPEQPTGPEIDAQSPREILGTFSEAKAAGHGVKITRRTAPGTPAGAIEVSRGTRREQIETARGIPDDQKPLWEKNFTPVKTVVTKEGIQEQGWSPEVLAANAEKTAKFLSDVNLSASPFEIDPTTKTFTASGWQNLFDKVNIYAGNQAVGLTGKGTPLEIGRAREFGFYEPTGTREAVGTLTDAEANFLNYLMGYPLPGKGATVKKKGAKQYGLQLISEATEPGRAQPLVEPRGGRTFEGKEAEQLGFVGEQLLEVNPLRAQIEQAARDAGVKPPSPIEVWQNLNVRDIVKAEIAPELPAIRPVGVTARAGFNPKQLVTPEKEKQFGSSAVRFADGTLKPVFHATVADFDPVNITTDAFQAHFGSPAAAAARVLGPMFGRNAEAALDETGAKTMPVFLDIKNPLKLPDIGNWESANDVARAIYEKFGAKLPKMLKPDYVQRTVDSFVEDYISIGVEEAAAHARANLEEINALKQWVEDQGYDGIVYENEFEAPPKIQGEFFSSEMGYEYGQDSYIAFSNEQIKSAIGPAKFAPMPANEMAIRSAAVRDETTGRIYEAGIHAMAQDDAISRGAKGPFTDGFVTNRKFPGNKIEFLDRDESFARAKEIGQIPEKTTSQYAGLPQLESNAFEEGRRFSPSKERKEIELEGPDGKKYRAMFDGYMDMSLIGLGQVPQITPLENLPGSKMRGSTTYGPSLEKAGYKLPADLPDAPIAETEAKFSPPKTDEQLRTGVEFTKFFSDVASGRFGKSDVPFESLQDLSDVANVEAERMKHWGNFENHIQRSIPMIHEEKTRLADGIIKTFGEGGARLLDIGSSEGDFGKAISALTDGKIETLSLEPNPDMAANFRDISTVEGATFTGDSFLKSFEGHPAHSPSEPYDIINEAVTFQFINPNRDAQVAEVKRMLKPDGIFLSVEKFKTDKWAENEAKKDKDFKDKYFTKSELAEKETRVGFQQSKEDQKSVGMVDNMVSDTSYIDTLQNNFKHVIQYWDSGNFKGFAASDSLPKLRELVKNIGDLNSEFSTVRTPRAVSFAPNAEIKKISSEYRDDEGIKTRVRPVVKKFNEDVAKEIADYYDAQPKSVVTPAARKSYDAFNAETRKQYESLIDAGYILEPWIGEGEPYTDSAAMRKDLADNKHLFYFPSKSGLGKGEVQKNYPPMEDSGVVINGEQIPYNDLFRAVHDVFGHGTEGRTFSMDGEFQAWQDHATMYSEAAQSALALETLGLNAWFNAGKHLRRPSGGIPKKGESDFVPLRDRDYAPRTIFEFPKELIEKAVGRNERGAAFSPKPNDPLAIKMAAVRDDTTGEIFTGVMHPVIVSKLAREGRNTDHLTDGFVTNAFKADENNQLIDGEFLNRDDTFYRALDRKQVDPKKLRSDIKEFGMMESTGFEKARKFSPPKREQFEDPETIREALSSPGWAVISNTQEALGKWNAPANLATAKALEADLREKGYEFIPVKGTYKGVPQGTDFLVADISTYDAQTLGKKYKQESVLTPKGLLYGDGTITPMDTANIMLGSEAKKQEFFSTLPNGLSFSVPLDFSKAPYQPVGEQSTLFGGREYESPANFTQAELRQKYPEAIIPKNSKEQIGSDIVGSPLYKESANPVQAFADKLVEFVNQYKDNPVYQLGLRWYSDFVPMLKKEYGADAPMVAQLLAASSPNEKPKMNFFYANDAIEGFKSGRFDKIISKFNQGFDMYKSDNWLTWYNRELKAGNIVNPPQTPTPESFLANWIYKHDLKPKQSNGQLYGFHGRAILEVMAGKWLQENKGPKVGNFVQNLLGAGHEATIDVWADRTMRRIGYADTKNRWRIMPANVEGVSDADFAFSQKAVRAAAERLGILPDALQGGLWFAEKSLWSENGWGRLDLGSYVDEMANLQLVRQSIKQRLTATKGRAKVKPMETGELKFSPKGNGRDVLKPGVYSVSTSYGATKDVDFEGGTTRQLYREYAGKVDEFGFKRMTFTGPRREKDIDVQPRPMNSNRDY